MVHKLQGLQRSHDPATYNAGQREYEFAAEVTPAPPSSVFRHTKVRLRVLGTSWYIVSEIGTPHPLLLRIGNSSHAQLRLPSQLGP